MLIFRKASGLTRYLSYLRRSNEKVTIGLVPTMGALHDGHLALLKSAVDENTVSVCTIFVNPTQFGDPQDLEKYPKPIENDIQMLSKNRCDVLFLPDFREVYPENYEHITFDLGALENTIEGASRPGHFQGVCNVISRLFKLVTPDNAYFGQKDFQQTVVVKRLTKLLKSDVSVRIVPISREPHGLARSSRNIRLSDQGRKNAAFIYKALTQLKQDVQSMNLLEALDKARQFISSQKGAIIDYLIAVDAETLEEVQHLKPSQKVVALTVVEYEGVRLLDNVFLS